MIYSKADLKRIPLSKEQLKNRKKVVEFYEPILINKVARQLKKLFSIIKLNGDKIDTTYFDTIIENKFGHIPYKLDSYYDERGIEIIEEVNLDNENVKDKENNFEQEDRNDFSFKQYLLSFGKLTLDKQIIELFSLYQVLYYGQDREQIDEDELKEYAIEFDELLDHLQCLGWPIYEGMHVLTQAVMMLSSTSAQDKEQNSKTNFDERDLLLSYLEFARDMEDFMFSHAYYAEELEEQTVYDLHLCLVDNFRTMLEQFVLVQRVTNREEAVEKKRELDSLLTELAYSFSRLYKEYRLDILQTLRARLNFYKDTLTVQSMFNKKYPYSNKNDWGVYEDKEIVVFSENEHLENISYFQMMYDYFCALHENIIIYSKRKYALKRTTVLTEDDVHEMIKEFHLDALDMFDYYEHYAKDMIIVPYYEEDSSSDSFS